jgi:phosphonopyruvate decarboxylase
MIPARAFIDGLTRQEISPLVGVPCSVLKPLINYVIDQEDLGYFAANNEGEAVALAAGSYLAGRLPMVMFQNSGLGNTVNPLSSLHFIFHIPALLIVTWRGEPGRPDAPQHELMGQVTQDLLDVLRIPHEPFPESEDQIAPALERAVGHMKASSLPFAFVMRKGSVEGFNLQNDRLPPLWEPGPPPAPPSAGEPVLSRRQALSTVLETTQGRAFLIATTGMTGRELYDLSDRPNHFYMVGSMGCASSLGLGIALHRPDEQIVVLDGDGAVLMRMEAMASVGRYGPKNLIHLVLDNGVHDSTGGQRTLARSVNIPMVAAACGYRTTASVLLEEDLARALETAAKSPGPHLVHVRIHPGTTPDIGRPSQTCPELAARFRKALMRTSSES